MGFSDTWHRTLVYFGLAEDRDAYDDYEEPDPRDSEAELESRYRERPNVRRLQSRRRRDEIDDIFADDAPSGGAQTRVLRPVGNGRASDQVRVHLVIPKSFNDAQDVADKFKDAIPVIINLTDMDDADAKRLVDFAAGLAFGLHGSIERVTSKVFLLSPPNVSVTAEDKQRIAEGGFFNQS